MVDDVEEVKLNFELYLLVVKNFGVLLLECFVFEDFVNGLIVVKRVGMKCVIVLNKVISILMFEDYDYRFELMVEMEFVLLFDYLNK